MNRGSFELSVSIPRDGRATPLREFGHNGFTYVESREGQKFSIKFRNNTARRVLAVPSIDCISVLEGTKATPQSRGYIIAPYSQVEIKGWRTSLNDINDFVFERKEAGKTYSEGTGEGTQNCGVIAVKVFEEKEKPKPQIIREEHHHHHHHDHWPIINPPIYPKPWRPWYEGPYWCSTGGDSLGTGTYMASVGGQVGEDGPSGPHGIAPDMLRCMNNVSEPEFTSDQKIGSKALYSAELKGNASATLNATFNATPAFNMGTGFGEHQVDRVTEEFFERGRELALLEIYYTDAAALKEIGIDVDKKIAVNVMPQSFAAGFCKAPSSR